MGSKLHPHAIQPAFVARDNLTRRPRWNRHRVSQIGFGVRATAPMLLGCLVAIAFLLVAADVDRAAAEDGARKPVDVARLPAATDRKIDFVQDVQPILRATCWSCHGAEMQESGLRLDVRKRAMQGGDSGPAIVPGDAASSRLLSVVAGIDDEIGQMPPDGEGTPLTAEQISVLRAWIEQQADWPEAADNAVAASSHWSFQPIVRPDVPMPSDMNWIRNPIDAFVLRRLQENSIEPSPEAPRATLLRRVHLDLIGLPPSPEEVAAYLADDRPDAYERLVDRLLENEHYGERWARHWLDLARYADSDGYEKDNARPHAWRFRQWVIEALNADMPFDEFTVQQIAGDLLPDAAVGSRTAVGFHRNTLHNTEGGTDQEEDRVKKTIDRTNTVGTTWLGLTIGCSQCHSHKYDPITQHDYYSLYAFFNYMAETDIPAPTADEQAAHDAAKAKFDAEHAPFRDAIDAYVRDRLPAALAEWEKTAASTLAPWTPLKIVAAESRHGAKLTRQDDGSILASGENNLSDIYTIDADVDSEIEAGTKLERITALRLEVLPDESLPKKGPGRADNGNFVLTTFRVSLQPAAGASETESRPVAIADARADFSQDNCDVKLAINDSSEDFWAVAPQFGARHVAVFTLAEPIETAGGARLTITLDQTYNQTQPHNLGRFRITATSADVPKLEGPPPDALAAIEASPEERTDDQRRALTDYFRSIDPELKRLQEAESEHAKQAPKPPETKAQSIAEQSRSTRETHVLPRGDFLRFAEGVKVEPGVLPFLPPLAPRGDTPDRLDLAQWLVSNENPLTPRVTVNHVWQRYFRRGLVRSSDDFGTQGDPPTHPQLLDWLACELRENGWSLKHIHRLIVTSSTYRQSSATRPELNDIDPENTLLARQNRRRVEAEIIRDLALASSGLLDPRIGGPSVRPPQPAEYEKLTYAGSAKWPVSTGGDRYRRGLYTFFQRTSPYPMLATFDAPDSTECTARRLPSNTPLQALTIWNDPVFFECAQHLGKRVVAECNAAAASELDAARIRYLFHVCLARDPSERETTIVARMLDRQRASLAENADAASSVVKSVATPDGVEPAELAAWIMVGRTILNLDEFITKE